MPRARLLLPLLVAAAFPVAAQGGAGAPGRRLPPARADVPALVVFITVDQFREDYFPRFERQLTGGLGRLWRGGAVMTNAFHDHANTETAPGHAAVLSGRFPRSTGIVRNSAGVQDPQAPLLESGADPASPFRFRGSTLFDWMRTHDPRARALSISRKDRGAILPIGRQPQEVYWYGYNGKMTTSTWYRDTLPTWVRRFNDRKIPQGAAGRAWTLLLPEKEYPEPDSVAVESGGRGIAFPHLAPAEPDAAARVFSEFPWMDGMVLDMALEGVRELGLGARGATDLLAVSLSTTDAVGHRYGPDSRELHDQVLRLDRMLGAFVDSLYRLRDSSRVVIALTADHGVTPYPEVRTAAGLKAGKVDLMPMFRAFYDSMAARGVDSGEFSVDDGVLFLDRPALARRKLNADSIARAYVAAARAVPGVLRSDLVRDLARADTTRDVLARRWLHSLPPDLGAEATITLEPYTVVAQATYAQHGSPHDIDAQVPVIFYGPPFKRGRYDRFARVVDMAPTLAWILFVTPTERLDGQVLWQVLK